MTPTATNQAVATAAQIYSVDEARDSIRRWTANARLWNHIKVAIERDRCIARAKVMQARIKELTIDSLG